MQMCVSSTASRSRSLDRVSRYQFVHDCFTLAAIMRARCRPGFQFHKDVFASAVPTPTCMHAYASACNNTFSVHSHSFIGARRFLIVGGGGTRYELLTRLILGYAPTYLNFKLLSYCARALVPRSRGSNINR